MEVSQPCQSIVLREVGARHHQLATLWKERLITWERRIQSHTPVPGLDSQALINASDGVARDIMLPGYLLTYYLTVVELSCGLDQQINKVVFKLPVSSCVA